MASKIVAVFLMCIVLASAISVQARSDEELKGYNTPEIQRFRKCFLGCQNECTPLESHADCEKKCDTKCRQAPGVHVQSNDSELKGYNTPEIQRFRKCFLGCQNECTPLESHADCEKKCDTKCRQAPGVHVQSNDSELKGYNTPEIQRFRKCFLGCQNECTPLESHADCEKKCDTKCRQA